MIKKKYLLSLIIFPLIVLYLLGMFLCFNAEKTHQIAEYYADMSEIENKLQGFSTASCYGLPYDEYKKLDMSKYDIMADLLESAGGYPYQALLVDKSFEPVLYMNDFIHFVDGKNNDRYYLFDEDDAEIKAQLLAEYENDNLRGEKYFYYFEDEDEKITPVVLVYRTPDKTQIKEIRFMDYDQKSEENKQFGTFLTVNGEVTKKIYSPVNHFEVFNYEFHGDKAAVKAVNDSKEHIKNFIVPTLTNGDFDAEAFYNLIENDSSNYEECISFSGEFMLKDGKVYNIILYSRINLNDYTLQSYNFKQQATTLTATFATLIVIAVFAVEYLSKKQQLKQSKYTFANAAAHELKTPLAVIQNQCECIMEGINKDNNDAYVASIYEEANRMNRLVKNLLHYNRLASGEKVKKEKNNLTEIAGREAEKYKALLGEKDLTIIKELDNDAQISCNDELISLVIDNFLSNAIRYSAEGSDIIVSLKKLDGKYKLSVFNKGDGVAEKRSKEIWGLLYRGDESRQGDSTGMGLALCAQILGIHKFKYGYKNRDGGVEFYFIAK